MYNLTSQEQKIFRPLTTPRKIQDFLETFKSYEHRKDTCDSPRVVLRKKWANCLEGAMLGALALRERGQAPLLLDLTATAYDLDHVISPFKINGYWGALSKSNHAVLRYRDPVYKSIRELVMSYFHEYTDDYGDKSLRSYSQPINLKIFDHLNWTTTEKPLWFIEKHLSETKHFKILSNSQRASLRSIDPIGIKAGKLRAKL